MSTSLHLISIHNTTNLTLEVFQHQDAIQVVQANASEPVAVSPSLEVKTCKTAEDYREHENEVDNPFFCIRDKNDIHGQWTRVFDPEGLDSKIALIHSGKNAYTDKFTVVSGHVSDGRAAGLYLKAEMRDDYPSEGKILWVVGEIVTDITEG